MGWHLPSDAEWKQLEMYLGMTEEQANGENYWRESNNEGGKLKELVIPIGLDQTSVLLTKQALQLFQVVQRLMVQTNLRYRGFWWSATCNTTQHYMEDIL